MKSEDIQRHRAEKSNVVRKETGDKHEGTIFLQEDTRMILANLAEATIRDDGLVFPRARNSFALRNNATKL